MLTPSVSPDITETLPSQLGATDVDSAYPAEAGWDVTFGPLGFQLRPSASVPYQRGTEDFKKQQIDTSDSPGEQSLSSWWVRSQNSWDMGAGVGWYEPGTVKETVNRFGESYGIDPWTPGQVSLLHATTAAAAARGVPSWLSALEVGGNAGYLEAYGATVVWTPTGAGTASTGTLSGSGATQPAAGGGYAWVGHTGGVAKFVPGTGVTEPFTCTGTARAWWVKARLIVAIGNVLYEVPPATTGAIATVGKVIMTHPDSGWVWSDVTETSGAVLAAGFSGGDSGVFRFSITNDTTGTPVMSSGSQVYRTPPGERITCMAVYLGTSAVIGTNRGVRVGQVSDAGDAQFGALTVQTANDVNDVTFRDRFAYLTVTAAQPGGMSGAVRVDLSVQVDDAGRCAYAWDASAGTNGLARSLCLVGERVFITVGDRVFAQSATNFVSTGWLNTGKIRFGTVEPKAFRRVRTVVTTNGGTASLTAVSPDGVEHRVVDFTDSYQTEDDIAVVMPGRPTAQYVSLNVYLSPDPAAPTASPVLSALSLKAVPAATRVRLYQYPLSCYDFETDRWGNKRGVVGGAFRRVEALEALETSGAPVSVVDYRANEAYVGQIDSVDFTATTAPSGSDSNFGGTLVVRLRRL